MFTISNYLVTMKPIRLINLKRIFTLNNDRGQKKFMEELLFVAKGYMFTFVVNTQLLKCLVMHQNPWVMFQNWKQMVQHAILSLMTKTWKNIWHINFGFLCYNNVNFLSFVNIKIWTWHIHSCHRFHQFIMDTLPCNNGKLWNYW